MGKIVENLNKIPDRASEYLEEKPKVSTTSNGLSKKDREDWIKPDNKTTSWLSTNLKWIIGLSLGFVIILLIVLGFRG